jgi:hypothetical protein
MRMHMALTQALPGATTSMHVDTGFYVSASHECLQSDVLCPAIIFLNP